MMGDGGIPPVGGSEQVRGGGYPDPAFQANAAVLLADLASLDAMNKAYENGTFGDGKYANSPDLMRLAYEGAAAAAVQKITTELKNLSKLVANDQNASIKDRMDFDHFAEDINKQIIHPTDDKGQPLNIFDKADYYATTTFGNYVTDDVSRLAKIMKNWSGF